MQYFRALLGRRSEMPTIVWIVLIIVIFGVAMFFLRRYMER